MGGDSFKSGSGNLNFGDEEEEADDEPEKPDDIANEEADDQEPEVATSAEVEESRTSRRTKNTNSPSEKSTTATPIPKHTSIRTSYVGVMSETNETTGLRSSLAMKSSPEKRSFVADSPRSSELMISRRQTPVSMHFSRRSTM